MPAAFMRTRLQLEQRYFPQGVTQDMIRLLDEVETLLNKAFEAGCRATPQEWSNQSAFGYAIIATERSGLPDDQINRIVRSLHRIFDDISLEASAEHYRKSAY